MGDSDSANALDQDELISSDSGAVPVAAEVTEIALCFELGRATAVVPESQLSLAIGKHGQNVRLAARLTGWDIDILTPNEYNQEVEELTEIYKDFSDSDEHLIDKFLALGLLTVHDIEEVGSKPFVEELGLDNDLAQRLVDLAIEKVKTEKVKPGEAKPEDVKSDEVKPEEAKLEDVKSDEVEPEEVKLDEAEPEEAKPEEVKPE